MTETTHQNQTDLEPQTTGSGGPPRGGRGLYVRLMIGVMVLLTFGIVTMFYLRDRQSSFPTSYLMLVPTLAPMLAQAPAGSPEGVQEAGPVEIPSRSAADGAPQVQPQDRARLLAALGPVMLRVASTDLLCAMKPADQRMNPLYSRTNGSFSMTGAPFLMSTLARHSLTVTKLRSCLSAAMSAWCSSGIS